MLKFPIQDFVEELRVFIDGEPVLAVLFAFGLVVGDIALTLVDVEDAMNAIKDAATLHLTPGEDDAQ
jgi:hypothetical protein